MLKIISKSLKFLLKAFLYFLLLIIGIVFVLYIICPIYNFPAPQPFAGNNIHNPYAKMDATMWRKANFHAHSRNYGGITDGRMNTNKALVGVYKYLDYSNYSISDYQKINKTNAEWNFYIPCYEHGYGVKKNHQLCIGAKKTTWLDFPLLQSVHQQQFVLDNLRNDVEAIAIAHPFLRKSYSPEAFTKLTNYDLVEVVNNFCISEPHWDSALSVGRRVYLVADDDAHNIENTNEVGRKFTMINSPTSDREHIISALKNGIAFGVDFHLIDQEDYYSKLKRVEKLPRLNSVQVIDDSIIINVSDTAAKFVFIGQRGVILDSVINNNVAVYKIKTEDNYVRTKILFRDGTTFFLNPVTRFTGAAPAANELANINYTLTWLLRIIGFSILFFFLNHFLIKRFHKIENKFIRFLFVGGLNTLFSVTVYSILVYIGLQYYIAVFVSNILGILFNFKTTGTLVFKNKSNKLIFKFFAVYLFTYFISVGSIKLLLSLGFDPYTPVVIIAIPMAVVSYFLMKKFVFTAPKTTDNM